MNWLDRLSWLLSSSHILYLYKGNGKLNDSKQNKNEKPKTTTTKRSVFVCTLNVALFFFVAWFAFRAILNPIHLKTGTFWIIHWKGQTDRHRESGKVRDRARKIVVATTIASTAINKIYSTQYTWTRIHTNSKTERQIYCNRKWWRLLMHIRYTTIMSTHTIVPYFYK